jgi:hypothetical protein
MQLELFTTFDDRKPLLDYWRKSLKEWPANVREWRHQRDTTGWSMATGGYSFARILFMDGKITRQAYKRWWKFHRRVMRWDRRMQCPLNAERIHGGAGQSNQPETPTPLDGASC